MHRLRDGLALVLLALAMALAAPATKAANLDEAIAHFTQDDFSETDAGVGALAESGDPRAATIIEALQDGRLQFSAEQKKVFYKDADGKLIDAVTGTAVTGAPPGDLDTVRINNRLRRSIDAAIGGLTLLSPDPTKRYEAAQAVFKSREQNVLPALEAAIAKESDSRIKRTLEQARAAIVLNSPDASEADKLDAVALLSALPADTPPAVAQAAAAAVTSISNSLGLWDTLQNAWYGVSLGSVLLLAAIGLAITFGVMGVINMAHGEMVMLGAYVTFVIQEAMRQNNPALLGWSLVIAVPLAFIFTGLIGIIIERTVIRFLYGRPLETLLATWGISLILQQAVRTIFGPTNREVSAPSWMSGAFEVGHLTITYNRLVIICFALAVFFALQAMLRFTRLGLSQIDNVSPNLGQGYIIDSFMVVVFGGVGSLWGTLVAAMSLGIANKFLEPLAGAVLAKIAILVLLILFIQKRPRGLFALKGRAVEA
jgi:urea transport system permease protein